MEANSSSATLFANFVYKNNYLKMYFLLLKKYICNKHTHMFICNVSTDIKNNKIDHINKSIISAEYDMAYEKYYAERGHIMD